MIRYSINKKTLKNQCTSRTKFSEEVISHWKHVGSPDTLTSATGDVGTPKSPQFSRARESLSWRGHKDVDIEEEGSEENDGWTFVLT